MKALSSGNGGNPATALGAALAFGTTNLPPGKAPQQGYQKNKMRRLPTAFIYKIGLTLSLLTILVGCGAIAKPSNPYSFSELVMSPGMRITATTKNGTVSIYADDELERTYTWDGSSRRVRLWPRNTRWYGSLGAYFPGVGSHWRSHNGIVRGVLEEGQMHFDSKSEALSWLNNAWHKKAGSVYNDNGLFVLFFKSPDRKQINIDVFQILVNGKSPVTLSGSSNASIFVEVGRQKGSVQNGIKIRGLSDASSLCKTTKNTLGMATLR